MAQFNHQQHRWKLNAQGAFYVDCQCLDCDLCRELAPTVFVRNNKRGFSYVAKQPETAEELARAREAVLGCPQDAIHDDGLQFDWEKIPAKDDDFAI
jgi:ferredoxin